MSKIQITYKNPQLHYHNQVLTWAINNLHEMIAYHKTQNPYQLSPLAPHLQVPTS